MPGPKLTRSRTLGALGIVFGDIGTSPLYALPAALFLLHGASTKEYTYGITSLIIWAIILVVTVKYVILLSHADNDGEGGVMAQLALLRNDMTHPKLISFLTIIGLLGVALFYGDSVITPAISVLSAVEGLNLTLPALSAYVVPLALVVLVFLFIIQSRGTGVMGKFFGPIMLVWFVAIGVVGFLSVLAHPAVLEALLPTTALKLVVTHPQTAFVLLGAVILAITGAEALYADMGHFGRQAVKRAWLYIVFPALIFNYLGQAALITTGAQVTNPFYELFPSWLQLPAVLLATLATLIASQAVISGAFSLTRQAVRLGYAPRMVVHYTSNEQGQVYLSTVNWLLCALVMVLVLSFRSSEHLAGAFGMAVSGTLLVDTILFSFVMTLIWKTNIIKIVAFAAVFVIIDLAFIGTSFAKFLHGAWLPILIALLTFLIMIVWTIGHRRLSRARRELEESISDFIADTQFRKVRRIPGVAVYLTQNDHTIPPALRMTMDQFQELPRSVVLVTVKTKNVPHVPRQQRMQVNNLTYLSDGIVQIVLQFGFNDIPNVPLALEHNQAKIPELHGAIDQASYVISNTKPVSVNRRPLQRLWKHFFAVLERNAVNPADYFHLPPERTIDMVSHVEI